MIHVAGGTYLEHCREPYWYELFGSGLRASLALSELGVSVRFLTFAGEGQKPVLQAKAGRVRIQAMDCDQTVTFSYLHPLSKPVIEPDAYIRACGQRQKILELKADKVLRFGMIEGSAKVQAKMVTYDPQTPGDPRPFGENGSIAKRLAVVANRVEARRLTGREAPKSACRALLRDGAEVAIIKCGSSGCVVGTAKQIANIPAYRTNRVWPIGSGDVFSALFALAWMEKEMNPFAAADLASRGTSYFVENRLFPKKADLARKEARPLRRLPARQHKQVYLAGPFFNLPQRWLIEEFRHALQDAGVRVFSPLHDVGRGGPEVVYEADMDGLRKSGVVLACLDGLDPGTIYEVGYGHSRGIKTVAFVSAEKLEDLKMITGGGSEVTSDFATALYLTAWAATCE